MDNVSPSVADATFPMGEPSAAPQPQPSQPLGPEGTQAPPPTGGFDQAVAPEPTTTPPVDPSQYISKAEYEALQQKLSERETLFDQIKQMADQQKKQEESARFKQAIRQQIADAYAQAADMPDSDRAIDVLFGQVQGLLDQVTQNYQQEVDSYHQNVERTMWELRAPGLANELIAQHGLDPNIQADLLTLPDEQAMTQFALRAKQYQEHLRTQFGQQMADRQAQQMRQSGVTNVGGEGSPGNLNPVPASGTAQELMPIMREIFGVR
jgi:hypothetical protein